MSVFNYMFDNDYFQRADIERMRGELKSLRRRSSSGKQSTAQLEKRLDALEDAVDELALLNQTMLRILVKQGLFTPEVFSELMHEIDLEDGVADGKITRGEPAPETCPKCDRRRKGSRPTCLWCGHRWSKG